MSRKISITLAIAVIIIGVVGGLIYFSNSNVGQNNTNESLIPGDFGPYGAYDKTNGAFVAISNKIRAIAYYEGDEGYVVVNDKKFGPYDGIQVNALKVTDNFWGITLFGYMDIGGSFQEAEKTVVINGDQVELGRNTDNVEFSFSDEKNSWGIAYDDMSSNQHKFIINNTSSTQTEYNALNKIIPYQNQDSGDYYVKFGGGEYLIGSISDEFANCMAYTKNKWGCSIGKKDNAWHIFVYENGIKKEYGPYGKFSDPREMSEFKLSNDGFIFCSSNLAVIHNNGSEKTFSGQDIYQCNYSEGNFGFNHASDKNKNDRLINVNGKEYGPYAMIDNFSLTNAGWGFSGYINKTDKSEYVVNGNVVLDPNIITGPSVSDDYWAVGYEKDGKLYMKVGKNKIQ